LKLGKGRKSPILRWGLRGTEVQVYEDRNLQGEIRAVGQIQENLPPEVRVSRVTTHYQARDDAAVATDC